MQKLKVYLTKNDNSRKKQIKRMKDRMLHSKSYLGQHQKISTHKSSNKHHSSIDKVNKSMRIKAQRICEQMDMKNKIHRNKYTSKINLDPNMHNSLNHFSINERNNPKQKVRGLNTNYKDHNFNLSIKRRDFSEKKLREDQFNAHNNQKKKTKSIQPLKTVNPSLKVSKYHQKSYNQINKSYPNSIVPNSTKFSTKKSLQKQQNNKRSQSASVKPQVDKKSVSNTRQQILQLTQQFQRFLFDVSFRTRKGIQAHNPNKVNQDRLLISQNNILSMKKSKFLKYDLYAVADGHGPCGHHVSNLIIQNLQTKMRYYLQQSFSRYLDQEGKRFQNKQKLQDTIISKSLNKTFIDLQYLLQKNSEFNAQYSGSTLVLVLVDRGVQLISNYKSNKIRVTCANVGDSRAIVIRQITRQNWEIIRLSDDHKPSRESERKRILQFGGRVDKIRDQDGNQLGPLRVWLPKKNIQGLAMSRSLGDNVSKPVGVICQPQILAHELDEKDKFIILASDGVWEFLSNYKILTLLIPFYKQKKLEQGCQALLKLSHRSWTFEQNTIVDDITFILIFISNGKTEITKFQKSKQGQEYFAVPLNKSVQEKDQTKKMAEINPNIQQISETH